MLPPSQSSHSAKHTAEAGTKMPQGNWGMSTPATATILGSPSQTPAQICRLCHIHPLSIHTPRQHTGSYPAVLNHSLPYVAPFGPEMDLASLTTSHASSGQPGCQLPAVILTGTGGLQQYLHGVKEAGIRRYAALTPPPPGVGQVGLCAVLKSSSLSNEH